MGKEILSTCLLDLEIKIITIKRTKDLNYFSLCALNLFNTEINELFHNILIYWDAPVCMYVYIYTRVTR